MPGNYSFEDLQVLGKHNWPIRKIQYWERQKQQEIKSIRHDEITCEMCGVNVSVRTKKKYCGVFDAQEIICFFIMLKIFH